MASWYLGINRGVFGTIGHVTASTSTNTTDFEVRIDTGKSSTKQDTLRALETFMRYIESNGVVGGAGAGVDLPPN